MSKPITITAHFADVEQWATHEAVLRVSGEGISLHFPKHGTFDCEDDAGDPIWIEYRNGIPHLVIWADINEQDPTHVISLEMAHLDHRKI